MESNEVEVAGGRGKNWDVKIRQQLRSEIAELKTKQRNCYPTIYNLITLINHNKSLCLGFNPGNGTFFFLDIKEQNNS